MMRSVLLLRLDGMGDIILFEPVLRALRGAWPEARLTVVVRTEYVELGPLLCPEVSWVGTTIDPIRLGPAEAESQLAELRQVVETFGPDVVVACTSRRNWLDTAIASMAPQARRIAFEEGGEDAYFGPRLRSLYPETPDSAFDEVAAAAEGEEQAWRRNGGLVRQVLGRVVELERPRLWSGGFAGGGRSGISSSGQNAVGASAPGLPAVALAKEGGRAPPTGSLPWELAATQVLREWGLGPGSYVVCAAAGFANVPIKTWPADRYASVLRWLRSSHGLPAVLIGSAAEREYLAAIANETGAKVWTPGANGWAELASLLYHSRLCLGNDTGALHLAGAVNCAVVGAFGGGTWPRFIPAGPGAVVVNPLPCFGCGWDCVFGDAPCVKILAPAAVQTALTAVLERKAEGECAIEESHHFLPETAELMGIAAVRWKERASALDRRERQFQETVRLASFKDGEIAQLKAETNSKDAEINSKDEEIHTKDEEIKTLKRETDGKDEEIEALKAATSEKDLEIETKDREIFAKDEEIKAVKAQADERDRAAVGSAAEAERIRVVAETREQEIEKLHRACAELQQACDERLALIIRLDGEVKALTSQGKRAD